jgi:hypothetical protein
VELRRQDHSVLRFGQSCIETPIKLGQREFLLVGGGAVGECATGWRLADPDELHRNHATLQAEIPPFPYAQAIHKLSMRNVGVAPLVLLPGQFAWRDKNHGGVCRGRRRASSQAVSQFVQERRQQVGVDVDRRQSPLDLADQLMGFCVGPVRVGM